MDAPFPPMPYAEAERLEPLVRRVLARNPSPFTYTGTQTYVVGAGEAVAVIDPGPDEPEHIDAILDAVGDARISAIVCTHTHRDHSPAAGPLAARTGAPVIGCAYLSLDDDGPRADAPFDATYRPDRVLADGETIAGPDWTLVAVATPGHTSNHLCYALAGTGALFTGDHVMGWSTSVISPPDGDMGDYLASLRKIGDRRYETLWPAHGPPIREVGPFLDAYVAHRERRAASVLHTLNRRGPMTVRQLVADLYADVDRRLHPAAAHTVLAHLIQLVREGEVDCADIPSLAAVFAPARLQQVA